MSTSIKVWLVAFASACAIGCAPNVRMRSGDDPDLARAPRDLGSGGEEDLRVVRDLKPGKDADTTQPDLDSVADDMAVPSADLVGADLIGADLVSAPPSDMAGGGGSTTGDTCADPILLPLDELFDSETTEGFADDYHTWSSAAAVACDDFSAFQYDAPDVVYAVEVPNGKTLTVVAQSQLGWDLAIAIFTDCGMPPQSCKDDADAALPKSDPELAEYTNSTGATQTVFVVVDGWDTPETGPFSIIATVD